MSLGFLAFFTVGMLVLVGIRAYAIYQVNQIIVRMGHHFNGTVVQKGSFYSKAIVRFLHGGRHCQLELVSTRLNQRIGDPVAVKLTVQWPEGDFRFSLTPEGYKDFFSRIFLGTEDILIGDFFFDKRYFIQSDVPAMLMARFDERVKTLVKKIDVGHLQWDSRATKIKQISAFGTTFFAVVSMVPDQDKLLSMVRNGVALVDAIGGDGETILYVEDDVIGLNLDSCLNRGIGADCLVCGDEIHGPAYVVCNKCTTPHHAECWSYVGCCSVYACGSKFAKPAK
ncbi:MAG: RING finger protein [Planctomycetota bacterium]